MGIGIVKTSLGFVQGIEYTGKYQGITVFKGIPYAKPPVGPLRWAPPEDPEPWDGVRQCDTFGPAPVQDYYALSYTHRREFYFGGLHSISEDCLYLNICTGAASSEEKRPVYMWFHGGGMRLCHANEVEFNPQELARKGVIVVSVGQRLNVFGYMALPQLSREQGGRSGNYGLMDQLKALDWVYSNIAAFGGDPDNITLGGQSGGCFKICGMAVSPASQHRVKRIINQSGLPWMMEFTTLEDAEYKGREFLKYIGVSPDADLEELRNLDYTRFYQNIPLCILPGEYICDGDLVPYLSFREAFDHNLADIDFLNCANLGEADQFGESVSGLNRIPVALYLKKIGSAADFYAHFSNLLGPLYDMYNFKELVPVTDDSAWVTSQRLATLGLTGSLSRSRMPGGGLNCIRNITLDRVFGNYLANRYPGSKSYTFMWSHRMPCLEEDKGTPFDGDVALAWHSSELWYTFASLRPSVPPHRPWREIDFALADTISSYWANFIHNSDPNGPGLPFWPSSSDYSYAEADNGIRIHSGMEGKLDELLCRFTRAEYYLDPV